MNEDVSPEELFWEQVYAAREQYFRDHIGPLPDDILKLGHMFGVWPGGGLFVIPAFALGDGIYAHATFGLSNPDMPATTSASDVETELDEQGRVIETSVHLESKPPASVPDGSAGYGYEIMVLTEGNTDWPLWFLQWAADAEILDDVGLLERVEKYNGLTIEEIQIGEDQFANFLIAKARPPLPVGTDLPNGRMDLLIATVITEAEMLWSMENGRDALLEHLEKAGIGQISNCERVSVIEG